MTLPPEMPAAAIRQILLGTLPAMRATCCEAANAIVEVITKGAGRLTDAELEPLWRAVDQFHAVEGALADVQQAVKGSSTINTPPVQTPICRRPPRRGRGPRRRRESR